MKRAALLFAGLFTLMLIGGVACGGGAVATSTPKPNVAPTSTQRTSGPTPTAIPGALEIGSKGGEELKFDKDSLTAKAGTQVAVRFKNNSTTLQHNWVLVKPGARDAVANAGAAASATDWIPNDPNVIAHTKLVNGGQTDQVLFTAPAVGAYQFVCTFPGHNAGGMFGDFVVTQ